MRLAAQVKGGFYPAHEEAVAHAASYLQSPAGEPFTILDPCAGEGAAFRQLSKLLSCHSAMTYAIELDDSRAAALQEVLPGAHVLAPADFFACRASFGSFSFVWLNPPFDDCYGGRRVEEQFLWRATEWLMPGGVMALVCPEDVVEEYSHARQYLARHYEHISVVPFPEAVRPFKEIIVFGHKRLRPEAERAGGRDAWEVVQAPEGFRYHIPPGAGPRRFEKTAPTEPELQCMLASSPLRSHLASPPESSVPSPPLPLGIGHVALLLASGHLDGVVQPEGKLPHVVRGTSRKHSFISDVTDTENDDGSTTTRTTISERIDLVIRTVDCSGRIRTFSEADAKDE
ncbi:MAG: class I SAM-dependent methyltransferase [Planctomycetes bacterium]|nr:class I SAM-dependent methyltransferase [Planctomycetota bacterium]